MTEPNNGPEYLESLADQFTASGDQITAAHLRLHAKAWNADKQGLHDAQVENTALQAKLNQVARLAA